MAVRKRDPSQQWAGQVGTRDLPRRRRRERVRAACQSAPYDGDSHPFRASEKKVAVPIARRSDTQPAPSPPAWLRQAAGREIRGDPSDPRPVGHVPTGFALNLMPPLECADIRAQRRAPTSNHDYLTGLPNFGGVRKLTSQGPSTVMKTSVPESGFVHAWCTIRAGM